MADVIQFIDGFDHYQPSSEMSFKWEVVGASVGEQSPGRNNYGQAVQLANPNMHMKAMPVSSAAWRIGFGLYIDSIGGNNISLFSLMENNTTHTQLMVTTSRTLRITRNGTTLGTGSTVLALDTWYHIEWYMVITDSLSTGNAIIRLNGIEELSLSSGDSRNGGTGVANQVWMSGASSASVWVDDLVISSMDTTTTPTFLGDRRIITLYPSGNGNYSDFDGSDGNSSDNYLLVDESADINLTDYIQSNVANERDSYAIENPASAPANIHAVQLNVTVGKEDAGNRTAKTFVRIGGTNYDSSEFGTTSAPRMLVHMLEKSPATASAWTNTELNNLEAGTKIEA